MELAEALAVGQRAVKRAAEQERQQAAQRERACRFLLDTLKAQRQRDPAIVAGTQSGLSGREIARLTGWHRATIAAALARNAKAGK